MEKHPTCGMLGAKKLQGMWQCQWWHSVALPLNNKNTINHMHPGGKNNNNQFDHGSGVILLPCQKMVCSRLHATWEQKKPGHGYCGIPREKTINLVGACSNGYGSGGLLP